MKLEQFKEIADDQLHDLTVDERMVKRIHQGACSIHVRHKPRVPRAAAWCAAACAAVMVISGSILLQSQMRTGNIASPRAQQDQVTATYALQDSGSMSMLSSSVATSQYVDGTTLSYGIERIGEFSEGYAPALATNGLYGYVNEDRVWVVRAMYDEADEVVDGKAVVKTQGTTSIIDVP